MQRADLADPIIRGDAELAVSACEAALARLRGKTVLVTGATGFVGGSMVDALLASNAGAQRPCRLLLATRSLDTARKRRPDLMAVPGVRWLEWPRGLQAADLPEKCEFVVHAAAPVGAAAIASDPVDSARQMIELTSQVVDWAKRHDAESMLLLSSGAADTSAAPSAYGEAKRSCETLCASSGLPSIAARLFACYGPRQSLDAGFAIPDFFRQALESGRIRVASDGKAMRAFCYVSDVVAALLKLLVRDSAEPRVINVGADTPVVSIAELAHLIAKAWGGAEVAIEGKSTDSIRPRYVPDVSRMKVLHRPEVGLEDGLHRMAESIRLRSGLERAVKISRA